MQRLPFTFDTNPKLNIARPKESTMFKKKSVKNILYVLFPLMKSCLLKYVLVKIYNKEQLFKQSMNL